MKCIIIFDHLNDIIYSKYNKKFSKHIRNVALLQGLVEEDDFKNDQDKKLNPNVIMQIFSPLVTSQRIMSCQFGNSYTSVQCQDGLNIAFDEYMGYLFVNIGNQSIDFLKRSLGICISFVRHLCGPDVTLLKSNRSQASLLSRLMDTWITLRETDQAILVEAVEQLMVNSDLASATLQALQSATDKLKTQADFSRVHAMILVQNKFLSLYSSRNAQDLSATDMLFITVLCAASVSNEKSIPVEADADTDGSEEFFSPSTSPQHSPIETNKQFMFDAEIKNEQSFVSHSVLLMGNSTTSAYIPHVIHITSLTDGVHLLFMIEHGNITISSGLYESFITFSILQTVQMQKDSDSLKSAFENVDSALKKTTDIFKKMKNVLPEVDACQKKLVAKWEFIRKKYIELFKSGDSDCSLRIESSTAGLLENMKELLQLTCFDPSILYRNTEMIMEITDQVKKKLSNFSDFLKVKALRNFTLGSASLTINKYLEEFPGLVHFLYIDRTTHRVIAPSLDFNSEETVTLTKKKIWSMIEFSRSHLQEGHLAFMWKDTTFNYAYFLWFEDMAGSPLKPKVFPATASKLLPLPGILASDFYPKLIEICFPKMLPNKVRCYELFCIHLGLATSSCVLEHTRRLAATIWEVTGVPNNPADLL